LTWGYIDLGEFLVVAEKVLGHPADRLAAMPGLVARADSALSAPKASFSGEEQYPDFAMKAAVLCARLIKNHPLPKGNKRVAFLCMNDFIERNGFELVVDDDEVFEILIGVAAGNVSEGELAAWLSPRIH
jgi:death on curing protein